MILREIPIEVMFSSAYALFLLAVAATLEKLAKLSQRRTEEYEPAGFRYHSGFDRWECPEGSHLVRVESSPVRRSARYRAPAHHCNTCKRKKDCTNSDTGREIEHHLDLWVRTGLHHFHRGLSFALIVLAASLLIVEAVRYPEAHIVTWLGVVFIAAFSGISLISADRRERSAP